MPLRLTRRAPIYVRFTSALVLAGLLTVALLAVVVMKGINHPTVLSNALLVAAGFSWWDYADTRRREKERIQETDRRIDDMIKGMHR